MAVAARRGHPRCKACALPVAVRAEIAKRARRGQSLRTISEYVVNEGHALGKDGINLHVKQCVGVEQQSDSADFATRSVFVASIVGNALQGWAGLASRVAHELHDEGLSTEADIVNAHVPETMRRALAETTGTPGGELLAARCLALAISRVLSTGHEDTARALAADLREQGAAALSDDLLFLADRASARATEAHTDRQSEGRCSPGSGSAPPAASNEIEEIE
jgi:hypothetical protein